MTSESFSRKTMTVSFVMWICTVNMNPSIAEEKNSPHSNPKIRSWIQDLADDEFQVREKATQTLIDSGKSAIPAVTQAISDEDAEVRNRASIILFRLLESADENTVEKVMRQVARSSYLSPANNRALKYVNDLTHKKFFGFWQIVSTEENGKVILSTNNQWFFAGGYLFASKQSPLFKNPLAGALLTLNPETKPKRFDCAGRLGIYQESDNQLKICFSAHGNRKKRPSSCKTRDGDGRYLLTLKRIKPPSPESQQQKRAIQELSKLRGERVISFEPPWISRILGPVEIKGPELTIDEISRLDETFGRTSGFHLQKIKDYYAALPHLQHFPNLRSLRLTSPKVTDRHLKAISHLKNLRQLNLYYAKITDVGFAHLKPLSKLEDLNLGYTKISNQSLGTIKNFKHLRTLNLLGVPVTDRGIAHLSELKKLQELSLCRTKVTDAGLKHLISFRNLRKLDLSQTKITKAGYENLKREIPNSKIRY